MMILADIVDSIERLMSGQSGFALGVIVSGLLTIVGMRWFVNPIVQHTKAANRLCEAVTTMLVESELKSIRAKGMEIAADVKEKQ